jgi:hypothetical protein
LLQTLALHAKLTVSTVGVARACALVVFDAITILANLALGALVVVHAASASVFSRAAVVDAGKAVAALVVVETALALAAAVLTLASTTKLALLAITGILATTAGIRSIGRHTAPISTF